MSRRAWVIGLLAWGIGAAASAGGMLFPGMGGREKPHPAIARLAGYTATLHTNLGDIAVELLPEDAPNAVRTFLKLAQRGFYDGTRFYCVFKDRMILAGDPTGTGSDDVGEALDYEKNAHGHTAGTLALDRRPAGPDEREDARKSLGSRFLINVAAQHHLDGDYTVFARITKGEDVARRIAAVRTRPDDGRPAPLEDIVIERITVAKKATTEEALKNPGDQEKQ